MARSARHFDDFRSPLAKRLIMREKFGVTDLLIPIFHIVCLLGMAIALFQYFDQGRLPAYVYLVFAIVQLFAVGLHFTRRNFLTATFGLCLTGMIFIAVAIEYTPNPHFDFVLTANAYTPYLTEKAYHTLLFSSSLFHILTVKFIPNKTWSWAPADAIEAQFARRALWFFLAAGSVTTYLTVRGSSIISAQYASPEYTLSTGLVGSAGIELISTFFLVFSLVAAVRRWGYGSRNYKLIALFVFFVIVYFRVLRGDRAASLGVFVTLAL